MGTGKFAKITEQVLDRITPKIQFSKFRNVVKIHKTTFHKDKISIGNMYGCNERL